MNKGRINERNIGNWTLDGEPKQRAKTSSIAPILTPEQEKTQDILSIIDNLLKGSENNYYSYIQWDMNNELLKLWADNGIIEKGIRKSKFAGCEDKEICILKSRMDLELVRGLLLKYK